MNFDYDLFVIGAGSGGVRLSRMAAAYGARVAIAEENRVGGTCVIRGCVPKKLLVYASHYKEELEDAAGYGWHFEPGTFSWNKLIEKKGLEIDRLNGVYLNLLANSGVSLFDGRATVSGSHHVEIGGARISAQHIVVATGSRPVMPDIPGIEHAISSNEALELPKFPERIAIVGGGYIALELAGIFNGLGAHVDVLYRGDRILRGFDDDVRDTLAVEMKKKGVVIRTRTDVSALEKRSEDSVRIIFANGTHEDYNTVLYATGRAPNTQGLGLEDVGVALRENGAIVVDEWSRTTIDSVHAIGDVTDRIQLTPVAIREGATLATTLFSSLPTVPIRYDTVPSAIFSQPEVATVGLPEAEARKKYAEVDIYRSTFRPLRHTLSGRDEKTFMKLVVDSATQRIVGAHMVGRDAAEIIQGVAIAVGMGATKAQFDSTIGIHPTAAEEFVTMR
ncbi:glutathione-disulfide reductase [Burkholderia cenocepacia]|uniref:Glutathione reductase n=1 Tax=Burkholderia cenocepacia TaxID=95486 RepID=A0AAN0VPC5_9BURK|nr:glutathione-disulfide reductase [Burkholderia cenocepacia]